MRIAISGAGIAGPTLAYWLHRTGHTPTLIEHAPRLRTGGYVIDFWGGGYQIAQRMGLEDAIRSAGYQVQEVRGVRRDGKALARLDVDAFRRAVDNRYVTVSRADLSAILFSLIESDVETIFGDTITAIADGPHGATVSFAASAQREFDLVIGADGVHSRVRQLAFPQPESERYLGCHVAAFVVDGYRPRDELVYVLYNLPGRQVGRFALREDRTLFLFIFRSAAASPSAGPDDVSAAKAVLLREFADAGWECRPILKCLDDVDDMYCDAVSQVHLDTWSHGRTALLGDAAAAVSLLAGEGTGLAMMEAYVLAGELQRAGDDYGTAFIEYERRLRSFVAEKQASAQNYLSFFAGRTRAGVWLRNLGMRVVSVGPLANMLAARSFRDDIELPDYPM